MIYLLPALAEQDWNLVFNTDSGRNALFYLQRHQVHPSFALAWLPGTALRSCSTGSRLVSRLNP
ncbi:MAG: hypothetical protein IPH16_01190 [Haliscomenobacter sp.]|nr:hypothetical protein [Haliscomenobacter sp.]